VRGRTFTRGGLQALDRAAPLDDDHDKDGTRTSWAEQFVCDEHVLMSSSSSSPNRRLYYRQPMYVRIDLRVSGIRVPVPATLIDLSGGGGMVTARSMLKNQVAVEFDLPRDDQPNLRLAGKIRKVTYSPSDRTFKYAIEFESMPEEDRDALLRFIIEEQRRTINVARRVDEYLTKPKQSMRLQEQRAHRRIEVNIPVSLTVVESGAPLEATAIDVSTGGARIITDSVLRQEWVVTMRFTLPNEILRALQQMRGTKAPSTAPFQEIRVNARALAGVKQSRGRYIQSLVWVDPDPAVTEEISRFVQAAQLIALGKS
jgi:c-di-GMP-binding flagellar brake protein YcgR